MEPDATYKYFLSSAFMVEELMRWLVADRHGLHALVEALDFATLTRALPATATCCLTRSGCGRRICGVTTRRRCWQCHSRESGNDSPHGVRRSPLGLENPLPSTLPELVGALCRRLRAPELRELREVMLSWAGWRG